MGDNKNSRNMAEDQRSIDFEDSVSYKSIDQNNDEPKTMREPTVNNKLLILDDTQVLYIDHQPRKEISEDQEKDSIFSTVESSAAATTSSSLQTHSAPESVQLFNENCDRAHS